MILMRVVPWLCLSAFAATMHPVAADDACGELENAFGPFDYRTVSADRKRLVEGSHFTPYIEGLQRGHTGAIGSEIDYTLRAFPNHPRALVAMMKLGIKE